MKFVKCTIKKCTQNNNVKFASFQIRSTLVDAVNGPIRLLLPQIEREPININKDDEYYEVLKSRQEHTSIIII